MQGNEKAQYYFGVINEFGSVFPENKDAALKWYLKAASNNYTKSFYKIAEIYHEKKDEKTLEWYLKAAESGDVFADIKLAYMFYEGDCVPKDFSKSIHHFQKVTQSPEADNDIKGTSFLMIGAIQLQQGQTAAGFSNFKKAIISSFVRTLFLVFAGIGIVGGLVAFSIIILILYFVLKGNKYFSGISSWSISEAIAIFALFIFFQVLVTILGVLPLFETLISDSFLRMLLWSDIGNLFVLFVAVVLAKIRPIKIWKQFGFSKINFKKLLAWVACCWLLAFALDTIYEWIMNFFGVEIEMQMVAQEIQRYKDIKSIIIVILFVGVVTPVLEELIFRGILYQALRTKLSVFFSVFISSFIFAVVHFNLLFIIPIMITGIACSYSFEKTKSIYTPIGIHIVNNLFTVIVILFFM